MISSIASILAIVVVPYTFSKIWTCYIKNKGITGQFDLGAIKISNLIDIVRGCGGEPYQHESYFNFRSDILKTPLVTKPIDLTYWQIAIVFFVIFYF